MEENAAKTIQKYAFRYLATSFEKATVVKNVECPICLDQCCTGIRLSCKHSYHISCLTKWTSLEPHCPLCRSSIHDQRSERTLKLYHEVCEFFKLPIEILLEFETSVNYRFMISFDSSEIERKMSILNRNLSYLKHSPSLTERYDLLAKIRRDVEEFDKKKSRISAIRCENNMLESIRKRLEFPFQHLYGRTKNISVEMECLNTINTFQSRLIRSRLLNLLKIERTIQEFLGLPLLTSRALIPLPSRQNALTSTFPRSLLPRALEEMSVIS